MSPSEASPPGWIHRQGPAVWQGNCGMLRSRRREDCTSVPNWKHRVLQADLERPIKLIEILARIHPVSPTTGQGRVRLPKTLAGLLRPRLPVV